MKKNIIGLIIISIVLAASFNSMQAEKKKYYELQSPYEFGVSAVFNDSCCVEVTVTNLVDTSDVISGHEAHGFSVYLNNSSVLTDWHYGDPPETFVICPPDSSQVFQIDVLFQCDAVSTPGDPHTVQTETLYLYPYECECSCDKLMDDIVWPTTDPVALYASAIYHRDCDGCLYYIKMPTLDGGPISSFTNCYDSISIDVPGVDIDTYELESFDFANEFNPDGYFLCVPDGTEGMVTISLLGTNQDGSSRTCFWDFPISCSKDSLITPPQGSAPCKPDCENDEYTEETETVTFINDQGEECVVEYTFYWRDACNGQNQDIQITEFGFVDGSACSGCTDQEIYAKALKDIIDNNIMNFEPTDYDAEQANGAYVCDTTWRISMGSCWSERVFLPGDILGDGSTTGEDIPPLDLGGDGGGYQPFLPIAYEDPFNTTRKLVTKCDDVDCCTQPIQVCKFENEDGIIETLILPIDYQQDIYNCDTIFDVYQVTNGSTTITRSEPCEPACDWLSDAVDILISEAKIVINNNNMLLREYAISDKHINDILSISMESKENTNIKINIFDMSGNIIDAINHNINGMHTFTIETNDFISGTYYYNIIIDGKLLKSNKFIIVR